MPAIKRIILDVLKPHQPNCLELAEAIASLSTDYQVALRVTAVDEKTENTEVEVCGKAIDFDGVKNAIMALGGTIHSIDAVDVSGSADEG